jgi:hypothetical protein
MIPRGYDYFALTSVLARRLQYTYLTGLEVEDRGMNFPFVRITGSEWFIES